MNRILHLPLKAKWYEMIESRVKTEEYREIKPYWMKRFAKLVPARYKAMWNKCLNKKDYSWFRHKLISTTYDAVQFSYGYTTRTMTFEIDSITIGQGVSEWGAPSEDVFIIKLGNRI